MIASDTRGIFPLIVGQCVVDMQASVEQQKSVIANLLFVVLIPGNLFVGNSYSFSFWDAVS